MGSVFVRFVSPAALVLLTHPAVISSLAGQELRGTVVEVGTERAIEGAFISLVDPGGVTRTSSLTATDGAYVLRTAIPGEYTLRVERIGYESWTSERLRLARGATITRRLEIAVRAVRLKDLAVTVESPCRPRAGAGPEMARVWEEARKALELNRWTEGEGRVEFDLRRWVREVDPDSGHVLSEEAWSTRRQPWRTFVSAPAERLAAEGWVPRDEQGGRRYFAPDAEVLLSDTFADGHCFTLIDGSGDKAGLVGLAFEPVSVERPDVSGVLWLDRGTAELRHVEYRYRGLELGIPRHEAGGQVTFGRLPTGHWFVRSWVIRMPVPVLRTRVAFRRSIIAPRVEEREYLALGSYRHVGGDAVRAKLPGGHAIDLTTSGAIVGVVTDPHGPVAAAEVELAGTEYRGRTDAAGGFRIPLVEPGAYTLLVRHPDAVLLGVSGTGPHIRVEPSSELTVSVAIPSVASVVSQLCDEAADSTALSPQDDGRVAPGVPQETTTAFGVVRDRVTGKPVPDASVWIARRDRLIPREERGGRMGDEWKGIAVRTDRAGRFVACHVPVGRPILAQAGTLTAASDTAGVRPVVGSPLRFELELAEGRRPLARFGAVDEAVDLDAVVDEILARGTEEEEDTGLATLVGTVRSAETGQPVSGARVRLVGREDERITGEHGTFVIPDLPRARYRVVTERLGLASDTAEVDLRLGAGTMASLLLETRPVQLPTLEVEIQRTFNQRLAGYYDRLDRGLGDFVTREDLEVRDVISNFRRIPSVRLQQCVNSLGLRRTNCWDLKIARGGGTRPCPALVYVDGHLRTSEAQVEVERFGMNPFSVLQNLPRDRLEGIEVYRSPAAAPAQYRMLGDVCGIILVWTRGR